jgi:hemolysin III
MSQDNNQTYSAQEEKLNVISHGIGVALSVLASIALVTRAINNGNNYQIAGAIIFGLSLILLYVASTAYHNATDPELRARLRIFDHAAIYVLIAGSYTPFALVTLHGPLGWIVFGVIWGMALIGIILKLFYTGRFKLLSTLLYVAMGWMGIFLAQSLHQRLPFTALGWMLGSGIAYTVGAILYSIKRMPFNHATFHIFVLIGSACSVIAIYVFVLAAR